jgi:hypothetical protein
VVIRAAWVDGVAIRVEPVLLGTFVAMVTVVAVRILGATVADVADVADDAGVAAPGSAY